MKKVLSVGEAVSIATHLGVKLSRRGGHMLYHFYPGEPPLSSSCNPKYLIPNALRKALLHKQESLSSISSSSNLTQAAGTARSTRMSPQSGSPPSPSSQPSLPPKAQPSSSSDKTLATKRTSPTSPSSVAQAASSAPPQPPSSPAPPSPSPATSPTRPAATPTQSTPPPNANTGRAYLSSLETWGSSSPATPALPSSASVPPPAPTSTTSSASRASPSTRASPIRDASSVSPSNPNSPIRRGLDAYWDRVKGRRPSPSQSSAPTTRPTSSGTQPQSTPSVPTSPSSSSGSKEPSPSSRSPHSSHPSPPRSTTMSGSTIKKLTQSEFYRLCEYLKNRKSDLESNPYSFVTLANQATTALKMDVSPGTISRSIQIVGIQMKISQSTRHGVNQRASIRILALAHQQLCLSLGVTCPPEIELLAQE